MEHYTSFPLPAHGFADDRNDEDSTGILGFFHRVVPLFSATTTSTSSTPGPSRPSSPPAGRAPHSRQHSVASSKHGAAGGESKRPSPPRRVSGDGQQSKPTRPRPFKLSSAAAPSVGLSRFDSTRSDMITEFPRVETFDSRSSTPDNQREYDTGHSSPAYRTIPGFPLREYANDDARSIMSVQTSSVPPSKVAQILRGLATSGPSISKDFWMKDELATACFNCESVFTTFRRRHHCRLCGMIFCGRCAATVIPSDRFGGDRPGNIRICDICNSKINENDLEEDAANRSLANDDRGSTGMVRSPTMRERFVSFSGLSAAPAGRVLSPTVVSPSPPVDLPPLVRAPGSRFAASKLFPAATFEEQTGSAASLGYNSRLPPEFARAPSPLRGMDSPEEPFEPTPKPRRRSSQSPHTSSEGEDLVVDDEDDASPDPGVPFRRDTGDDHAPSVHELDLEQYVGGPESQQSSAPTTAGLGLFNMTETRPPLQPTAPPQASLKSSGPATTIRSETPTVSSPKLTAPNSVFGRSRAGSRANELMFADSRGAAEPTRLYRLLSQREPGFMRSRQDSMLSLSVGHEIPLDLPPAAKAHISALTSQGLAAAGITKRKQWERILPEMLSDVARWPTPNVRGGDSMDIRSLVRIKKIPGGLPKHSEYQHGVVFTKNVVHKAMPRVIGHPRIMLVSFPIEYQRNEGQLMSLEPIIQQERDYLRNLVARLTMSKPHIIVCEHSIASLAADELLRLGVVVVRNVKANIMQALHRSTGADIISSLDRLALEHKLGRCTTFRVTSYQHKLIPNGPRKTVLRFEGGIREAGGTIVLRGGDYETLVKVKRLVDFLVLAVFSLRLETFLLLDEHVINPKGAIFGDAFSTPSPEPEINEKRVEEGGEEDARSSEAIDKAMRPFKDVLVSTSTHVRYPPPYALRIVAEDEQRLRELRTKRDDEEAERILREERGEPMPVLPEEMTGSMSRSSTMSSVSIADSEASMTTGLTTAPPSMGSGLTRSMSDTSLHSVVAAKGFVHAPSVLTKQTTEMQLAEAEDSHAEHVKVLERYQRDKSRQRPLDPALQQHLVVLHAKICSTTLKACEEPTLLQMSFYRDGDTPLGQYLEDLVACAMQPCGQKDCEKPNVAHHHTYVHERLRVQIITEQYPCPLKDRENSIIMWSYCKICEQATEYAYMREQTWQLSFAKYLELSFYPSDLEHNSSASRCMHNVHRDMVRYFTLKNLAVRIHTDAVSVADVAVPSLKVKVKPTTQLRLRAEELRTLFNANAAYWDSVAKRIALFSYEGIPLDRVDLARAAMTDYAKRMEVDRKALNRLLEDAPRSEEWPSASALNGVRRALQKRAVAWDADFASFEQRFIPTEKDLKRLQATAAVGIRRLFSDQSAPTSPEHSLMPILPLVAPAERDETLAAIGLGFDMLPPSAAGSSLGDEPLPATTKSESDSALSRLVTGGPPTPLTAENIAHLDSQLASVSSSASQSTPSVTASAKSKTAPPSISGDRDDSGSGSDTTVCADGPLRSGRESIASSLGAFSGLDSDTGEQVYSARKIRPATHVGALVKRFDPAKAESQDSSAPSGDMRASTRTLKAEQADKGIPSRPSFRRGKSDVSARPSTPNKSKSLPTATGVVSDDGERDGRRFIKRRPAKVTDPTASPSTPAASRIPTRSTSMAKSASDQSRPSSSSRGNSGITIRPPVSGSASATVSREQSPVKTRPSLSARSSALTLPKSRAPAVPETDSGGSSGRAKGKQRGGALSSTNSRVSFIESKDRPSMRRKVSTGPTVSAHGSIVKGKIRHFENQAAQQRKSMMRARARPLAASKPVLNVYHSSQALFKDDSDEEQSGGSGDENGADDEYEADELDRTIRAKEQKALLSLRPSSPTEAILHSTDSNTIATRAFLAPPVDPVVEAMPTSMVSLPASPLLSYGSDVASLPRSAYLSESEMSSSGTERQSFMRTLSSIWTYRGAEYTALEYPLQPSEHIFDDNPVVLREDEPSSIIAFTLSSRRYRDELRVADVEKTIERLEGTQLADAQPGDRTSQWTFVEGTEADDMLRKPESNAEFEDNATKFTCRVLFAEQFDALRRNADCEQAFIESLSRCVKWDAAGGKSGAGFLKTRDDRFIVKQLSRSELDSFLQFSTSYFDYISRAFFHGLPTILAKILGLFRIGYRNSNTGKSMRLDVLVMENLFYERKIARIYDLKGSTRNRRVTASGKPQEVLLDENLLDVMSKAPLYIREDSKKLLQASLFNDTLFLASLNVMDYSLVVGVDSDRGELVVGIIDFVRQYTWDKRFEHWIKNTNNKQQPTVVTPYQYKMRFRHAMDGYFLVAPDAWCEPSKLITSPAFESSKGVKPPPSNERYLLLDSPTSPDKPLPPISVA